MSPKRAGAVSVVHLPRSLAALFPGAPRRLEVQSGSVTEVIDDLERQVPGIRNRLLEAGPSIRTHLNVFVAGQRATLETLVPPGTDVHVIPAVSGGELAAARLPRPRSVRGGPGRWRG